MRQSARWLVVVGTVLLVPASVGLSAADDDEMVPNPLYKYWASFKPGSTVTLLEKTAFGGAEKNQLPDGIDQKEVTTTLLKVSPASVVVSVVVVERDFLSTIEAAPTKKTYPATIKKSHLRAGLHDVDPVKGVDFPEVLGSKVPCTTWSGKEKKEGSEVDHKLWLSDKVPGGIVKHNRVTKQDGKVVADTTIIVTAYKAAK